MHHLIIIALSPQQVYDVYTISSIFLPFTLHIQQSSEALTDPLAKIRTRSALVLLTKRLEPW